MIADLIRSCKTEAAVYLLLTDYIEIMRGHQNGCRLPLLVTRLPIGGRSDVAQRFRQLIAALLEPSSNVDQPALIVIIEALRAFGAAVSDSTDIGHHCHATEVSPHRFMICQRAHDFLSYSSGTVPMRSLETA